MCLRVLLGLLFASSAALSADMTISERISKREFPSVFQAWNAAPPATGADVLSLEAKHDLVFLHPSMIGLRSDAPFEGIAFKFTPESISTARARRASLLAKNPDLILLAEIRYRDAPKGFIPEESPWWKRDAGNEFIIGWAEGGYRLLDVAKADWQTQVAKRAKAVVDSGVFDGVMLDWWADDETHLNLIRTVRASIGEHALVLVNANDSPIPLTGNEVNGLYMECYRSSSPEDWNRISDTLRWAETHLRLPHINCLETWFHHSRSDLNLMRAATALSLTQSDGYCLFADPNELSTPDHLHDWYPFWDKTLGRPEKPGVKRADGAWERAFAGGTAIYNPAGNSAVSVHFNTPHRSRASGRTSTDHTVNPNDGDILIGN